MDSDGGIAGIKRNQGRRTWNGQGDAATCRACVTSATATATSGQGPQTYKGQKRNNRWRQFDWRHEAPRNIDTRCADNGRGLSFRRELMTISRDFVIIVMLAKKRGRIQ